MRCISPEAAGLSPPEAQQAHQVCVIHVPGLQQQWSAGQERRRGAVRCGGRLGLQAVVVVGLHLNMTCYWRHLQMDPLCGST